MLIFNFKVAFCITFLIYVTNAKHHRDHHHSDYSQQITNKPPYLQIDAFGNCHANDRQLNGRCVRFQSCSSAVWAWQHQQIQPLSCYYTMYENFVCCPDVGTFIPYPTQALPFSSTLAAHLPLQSPPPTSPYENPIQFSLRAENLEEAKNEQACSDYYESKNQHRRGHRNKRADAVMEENSTEIIEELIKKDAMSVNEAVGGVPVYEDEFPYMCALGWKSKTSRSRKVYNCGCVLIAKKYVLTAAHCASIGGESPTEVRLGGVDLDERNAEIIKIKRIIQHPEYLAELAYHDIAVVKLEKSSRETPACLWNSESLPQQQLMAIGYGQTKFAGPSSNSLLKVFLNVLTNQQCSSFYKAEDKLIEGIGAGQICAGDANAKMDTCQGDSGGPLLMKLPKYYTVVPYVVGLTSFGEGCASGTPSVYTRISNYIGWIESIVWN